MQKRIALYIIGFALAVGAFFLYRQFSGAGFTGAGRPKPPVATGPAPALPMTFESRNEGGELEYIVTATQAEQLKDAAGRPLPGQFRLKNPVATMYDKTARTLEIRGDQCFVVVDQGIRPNTSGSGNLLTGAGPGIDAGGAGKTGNATSRMMSALRFGKLSGNVRLTLSPINQEAPEPSDAVGKAMQSGLRIFFGGDVEFDGDQRTLRSQGPVTIDSDLLWFAGAGFELVFNIDSRRLEYLRIDQENKEGRNRMVVRGVGDRFRALTENGAPPAPRTAPANTPATTPAAAPAPALPGAGQVTQGVVPAATKPGKEVPIPPVVYRLTFGQDVEAKLGQGMITMDGLHLLFLAGRGIADEGKKPADPPATRAGDSGDPGAGAGELAGAPATAPAVAQGPNGAPVVTKDDLEISWKGPMEVRPASEEEMKRPLAPREVALVAVGTQQKPVTIRNEAEPKFEAFAGRLTYHTGDRDVMLEPAAYEHVVLRSPALGEVDCRELRIDQGQNRVRLLGPGILTTASRARPGAAASEPTSVAWSEPLDLELEEIVDPSNPEKKTMVVRRAIIHRGEIRSADAHVTAELMDVLLATVAGRQELEHFVATGNVAVDSLKRGGNKVPAGVPTDGLRASRLEIMTRRAAAAAVPEVSKLLATGTVTAWQYGTEDRAARNDPAKLVKQMVTTARLETDLKPKARTSQPGEATFTLGTGVEWTRFVASEGVRVDITPRDASRAIVATAQSLEAIPDVVNGTTATLKSADAPDALVKIGMGKQFAIQGRTVLLDDGRKTFEVPGKGMFTMGLVDKKSGKETPMQVEWAQHMRYDDRAKLAVFTGAPWARMAPERPEEGYLKASDRLTVQLIDLRASATAGTRPAGGNSANDLFASGDVALDYIEAEGRVDASGAQYGENGERLARLRVNTAESTGPGPKVPERLIYREATRRFEIPGPGFLAVENTRPDKPGERYSSQGVLNFGWAGNFAFDGNANTISFQKDVRFKFEPKTSYRLAAETGGTEQQIDSIAMMTDNITVRLTGGNAGAGGPAATQSAASPIGLGAGGDVSSVEATGRNTTLVAGQTRLSGNIFYDVARKFARVEGVGDEPAVIVRPGQGTVFADQATWDMAAGTFNIRNIRGSIPQR